VRALVTGGAGFIGSHLVDALLARGDRVAVVDDLSTGRHENLAGALAAGAALSIADIADAAELRAIFDAARPEVVFHLAAHIDVRRSVADPAYDARVNVEGTINVLEASRRAGARRFVFASSGGAIYGEGPVPNDERTPVAPLSPYGESKRAGEGYCELYARLHGLATVSLRFANVYGPRQDPLGEGGVCAIFCNRLLDGAPATIHGDGRQTRDFVYVGDVARALQLAGDSDATGAYNVGTGRETSVLDLVARLDVAGEGRSLETTHGPARLGEVMRSALDTGRAREVLGWEPQVDLTEGLRRTLSAQSSAPAVAR
jgi:UDP-glucose 4-epimerase